MPNIEQHGYRAYPLPDQLADKVVATFQRYGPQQLPSTRYKDLVDLVGIVSGASLDAEAALRALTSEAKRRRVQLPPAFDVPDRGVWEPGYSAEARRTAFPVAATLDEALAIVGPCWIRSSITAHREDGSLRRGSGSRNECFIPDCGRPSESESAQ